MKRLLCIALIAVVLFPSLILFVPVASAQTTPIYTNLPEPVPSESVRYFVIVNSAGTSGRLFAFYFPATLPSQNIDVVWSWNASSLRWTYTVYYNAASGSAATSLDYSVAMFLLTDGTYQSSWVRQPNSTFTLGSSYTTTAFPNYQLFGCSLTPPSSSLSGTELATIQWQGKATHDLLSSLVNSSLDDIYNQLSDIYGAVDQIEGYINQLEGYTDGIEGYIDQLEGYLDQVETLLTSANTLTTQFKTLFQSEIDDVEVKLTNIYNKSVDIEGKCNNIITLLTSINANVSTLVDLTARIYRLLGGEETVPTYPDESEFQSNISGYVNEEGSYMNDFDSHIGQFGSGVDDVSDIIENNIGDSNDNVGSGFLAFNYLFQTFVLNMPLVYILLFFSLMFGIFVLILGKKV